MCVLCAKEARVEVRLRSRRTLVRLCILVFAGALFVLFAGRATLPLTAQIRYSPASGLARQGASAIIAGQPAPSASPSPAGTQPAGESGGFSTSFNVGGMVSTPATYTLAALQAMPSQTVSVQFHAGAGTEQHMYQGVSLYDLLNAAGP